MKRFGTKYGGYYYPKNLIRLNKNSIIYCFGAGEDISHDLEIACKLESDVHIFDPTPRAVNHIQYIKDLFNNKINKKSCESFGGGDPNYLDLIEKNKIPTNKIKFYNYGLFTENGNFKFYKPKNNKYVSHSIIEGIASNNYINVEMKTLKTIMKELNHTKIDLLKLDIEGCECDILEQMINENIYPKYIAVDFDLGWTSNKNIQNKERCYDIINLLKKNNYKILHNMGPDYSFVRMV